MELVNTKRQATLKKKGSENYEENTDVSMNSKRSAESSEKVLSNKKRSILCDITNAHKKIALKLNNNAKPQSKATKTSSSSINDEQTDRSKKSTSESPSIKTDMKMLPKLNQAIFNIPPVPEGVENFDKTNKLDINSESIYAPFIFAYYKEREKHFIIEKYMSRQTDINKNMRACLIDWLVEIQESFELNHETLYLAVKLVDLYLMRHEISKAILQLIGATSMLIASKYDERIPPVVDDFLYICDDTYTRTQLLHMEECILKTINFDLGIPLSYRFLRRYARCVRASMETLTLARFILETCLMDYDLIDRRDSKMAAAAFMLALRMKNIGEWTLTLEYYSGYKEKELEDLVKIMNKNISENFYKNLVTVRNKYSHKIFFEVAKIPPLQYPED